MNDHNLDDLIIGEPRGGGSRSKNILAVAAIILVVLIAGVTLARLFFGNDQTADREVKTELSELVNPKSKNEKKFDSEIDKMAEESNIPEELKPLDNENLPKTAPDEGTKNSKSSEKVTKENSTAQKPLNSKKDDNIAQKSTLDKKEKLPKKTTSAKKEIERKNKSTAKKNVTPPKKLFKQGSKRYIQIGSFSKKPNEKYLKDIKAKGFNYTIMEQNGLHKVLVGPYSSYDDAKAKLPEVREKLNKAAFIK